ncbi:MAG: hypothetical protein ACMG57_02590 [Candidatus Dojkabacteria bacterium]
MNSNLKKVILVILILLAGIVIGITIPSLIQKKQDFDNYVRAREAAPNKEEFDKNFDNMIKWFEDYKRDNPGSTSEDAQKAFDALWGVTK